MLSAKYVAMQQYCGENYWKYRRSIKLLNLQILNLAGRNGEYSIKEILSWVQLYGEDDLFLQSNYYKALSIELAFYVRRKFIKRNMHLGEVYFQWNEDIPLQLRINGTIDTEYEFRKNYFSLRSQCEEIILKTSGLSKITVKYLLCSIIINGKEDLLISRRYKSYINRLLLRLALNGYFQIEKRHGGPEPMFFIRTGKPFSKVEFQNDFFIPL